jgi:hypothetical protein
MSALERVCAQCQGKLACFEIVRIKDFNFCKKTSTHTYTHTLYSFNTPIKHFKVHIVVQLHAALAVCS